MTSSLNSGSPAPSIEALDWLRGDRLPNFKLGKIYILDFLRRAAVIAGHR
ncbi:MULTISPECIES: hypothetical protein [Rhizobium]|uniref:Uncharacterized protein n=1 Tax=Rhizobium binae TaxID=1138190 RepID=A0ABV2MS59_9HYPH|nr:MULTISPECIES: hypothetical protein [Rhizobium]